LSGGAYPKRAIQEKREGVVQLRIEVLTDGRVGSISIYETSGHRDLDETAIAAARNWHFHPALSGDSPVTSELIVPVRYRLKDAR
jgi:protein TonB